MFSLSHEISKFSYDGKYFATSWIQLKIFGRVYIFAERKIEIPTVKT
jgi:hypothetical protein